MLNVRKLQNAADSSGISLRERFELEIQLREGLKPLHSFTQEDRKEEEFRGRVAEVLIDNGMVKRAARFLECLRFAYSLVCDGVDAHKFFAVLQCDFRFCPLCAPRMFLRLFEKYSKILACACANPRSGFRLREITLTSVNTGSLTGEQIRKFNRDVKKTLKVLMRHVRGWGAIWSNEVGFNNLNLHAHILFYGPYVEQQKLSRVWRLIAGHQVVWIKQAPQSAALALRYLLKYVSKPPADDPELVGQLEVAFYRCRRIHTVGLFYNFKPPETSNSKKDHKDCPICGGKLRRILGIYRIEDLAIQGIPFIGARHERKERKIWTN